MSQKLLRSGMSCSLGRNNSIFLVPGTWLLTMASSYSFSKEWKIKLTVPFFYSYTWSIENMKSDQYGQFLLPALLGKCYEMRNLWPTSFIWSWISKFPSIRIVWKHIQWKWQCLYCRIHPLCSITILSRGEFPWLFSSINDLWWLSS